ncbi:hypothetical protein [Brevibacterium atlanticum]|uniref:hypothetical protein n=1 Tax=Brevibacterium atlanticum TaxID=2697563 RepID=UPI00141DCE88|nr:hypothetical protein [Brevibacterium atlanticum]
MGEDVDPGVEAAIEGRGRHRVGDGEQAPLPGTVDDRLQRRDVEGGRLRCVGVLDDDLDEIDAVVSAPVEEPLRILGTGDTGLGGKSHHRDLRAPRRRGGRPGTEDRRDLSVGPVSVDDGIGVCAQIDHGRQPRPHGVKQTRTFAEVDVGVDEPRKHGRRRGRVRLLGRADRGDRVVEFDIDGRG